MAIASLVAALCVYAELTCGIVILNFNYFGENLLEAILLPIVSIIAVIGVWNYSKEV